MNSWFRICVILSTTEVMSIRHGFRDTASLATQVVIFFICCTTVDWHIIFFLFWIVSTTSQPTSENVCTRSRLRLTESIRHLKVMFSIYGFRFVIYRRDVLFIILRLPDSTMGCRIIHEWRICSGLDLESSMLKSCNSCLWMNWFQGLKSSMLRSRNTSLWRNYWFR
jgi:hypothetical protein